MTKLLEKLYDLRFSFFLISALGIISLILGAFHVGALTPEKAMPISALAFALASWLVVALILVNIPRPVKPKIVTIETMRKNVKKILKNLDELKKKELENGNKS